MSKVELTAQEKKLLKQAYIGSLSCMRITGNVTGMGKAMVLATSPFIQAYYKTEEEKREAILREASEYFNTHQAMLGLIAGIVCAMEKERGETGKVDASTITSIKAALMGPLAGIGDSFFFNCYRLVIAGIAIGLSDGGNILGPLFFFVFYGIGLLVIKYVFVVQGYKGGVALVEKATSEGIMPMVMEAFTALGGLMIGALVSSNVSVSIAWVPVVNGAEIDIQGIIDTIMPGLLGLVLFFVVVRFVKKGVSPIVLIFSIMGICLLLALLGIF